MNNALIIYIFISDCLLYFINLKWSRADLNCGPLPYQSSALNQAELRDLNYKLTRTYLKVSLILRAGKN